MERARSNEDWLEPQQRLALSALEKRLGKGMQMMMEEQDKEKAARYFNHWTNLLMEYEDMYLKFGVENGSELVIGAHCPLCLPRTAGGIPDR